MLGKILTDTLQQLEQYQTNYPEEVSDIQFQLETLKIHIKWIRGIWEEPTFDDIKSLDSST